MEMRAMHVDRLNDLIKPCVGVDLGSTSVGWRDITLDLDG